MQSRRLAVAALLSGFAVVLAAQHFSPIAGPPLYDGVVVEDTYKWFSPPAGFPGGAQSASASGAVQGTQSPDLSVGTPEQPPQAQVFAGQGYLVMPAGTATINVSIEPVAPAAQPTDGVIAGNVYRFSLTNQAGAPISGQPDGGVTIVLRGPPSLPTATIERLDGSAWRPLPTDPAGTPHMFTAVVTDFGDFALVAPPGWVPASPGANPPVQVGPVVPGSSAVPSVSGSPETPVGSGSPPLLPMVAAALALVCAIVAGVVFALRRKPKPLTSGRRPPRPGSWARRSRDKPQRRRR
jgi:hypothetical protein